ncbi:cytochrome c biogenesis protein CcsA [Bacteroides hominis]|uniref:cytochrome c biogenesis protein CcsA n=1 Tax=Bacteroides hominis TaxID=2763023 RepID=UPI003D6A9E53
MITWDNFYLFATVSVCLWLIGAISALRSSGQSKIAIVLTVAGITCLGIFIAGLWISLQRPPLRTMGETRLWYSFFMGIAGLLTYIRWKYQWILSFSTLLSTVFVIINLLKPEIHDQSLMPALQSVWFIPHVTVYMFSYSVLGCAFIIAICGLVHHKEEYLVTADNLVYSGVAFLSIGMLLGSLWAKEAWGNYWSWDPKETWAVVTWMGYLLYMHLRLRDRLRKKMLYVILIFSFLALQMCWYGVNYLPSAQQSVHLYNRNN